MAKQYYDRYNDFRVNNTIKSLPYIKIPEQSTDITIQYKSRTRLDIVSQTYYGTPYYGPKIAFTMWESDTYNPDFLNILKNYDSNIVLTKWQKECLIKQGFDESKIM